MRTLISSHNKKLSVGFSSIYAVSDIHTDYAENLEWVAKLSSRRYQNDVLVVAGDVSDKLDRFATTMDILTRKFGLVFFVPGNHDLWVKRDGTEGDNSLHKLELLEQVCEALGVLTTPQQVSFQAGSISICPLLSFYHESFDTEPEVKRLRLPSVGRVMADYRACKWPPHLTMGSEELALTVDGYNERQLAKSADQARHRPFLKPLQRWKDAHAGGSKVISVSHFLPRIELIPEKRYLNYPHLMKAVGSDPLGKRVASLNPNMHLFGHTHFGWDAEISGVRYVQAALATPRERNHRRRTLSIGNIAKEPLKVYDGSKGFVDQQDAWWSNHYQHHERIPFNVEPAPWVLSYYLAKAPHRVQDA